MKAFQIARRVALSSAFLGVLLVLAGVLSRPALADTCTSNGTDGGDWSQSTTWQAGCPVGGPGTNDDVLILNGDTVVIDGTGSNAAKNVTIEAGGELVANANTLSVSGDWANSGEFIHGSGTVLLNGGTTQMVSGDTIFYNLTISVSGTNVSFGTSSTTIANQFSKTGGSMNANTGSFHFIGTAGTIVGSGSKDFYVLEVVQGASISHSGGSLTIRGSFTNNGTFTQESSLSTFFSQSASILLSGSGSTTFGKVTVQGGTTLNAGSHDLTVTGNTWQVSTNGTFNGDTATVIFHGATSIAGAGNHRFNNVVIGPGNTLSNLDTSRPISIKGDWTNNGTYTAGTETVTLNGSAVQTIGGANSTAFANLTINNSSGNADGITLAADQTVDGVLTMSDGYLKVAAHNLTLGVGATINGGSIDSMVVTDTDGSASGDGFLCKQFTSSPTLPTAFTFPVGDTYNTVQYTPATLTFNSGTFSSGAQACVRVTNNAQPQNTGSDKLNRYWTVTSSGIDPFSCDVTFTYADDAVNDDVIGNEASLYGALYSDSTWTILDEVNSDNNTFGGTVTTFGDFTAGDSSLPVSLSYFEARPVGGEASEIVWQTTNEVGNVGWNVYAATKGGERVQLNEQLIATETPDSLAPRDYSLTLAMAGYDALYLEEVDLLGRTRLHGPFQLGRSYGAREAPDPVDWEAIGAEHAAALAQRESRWLAEAGERVSLAREQAQPVVRTTLTNPLRVFLPSISGTGAGIALQRPLLDLLVRQTGLQRVTYAQLAAAGVDLAGVPAAQIALLERGEPAPLWMQSGTLFGPGAWFEFYGQALDTLYSDTAVYQLLLDDQQALRIALDSQTPSGDGPAFYRETDRFERQRTYSFAAPNGDPWYDTRLLAYTTPTTATFSLSAPDLVASGAVTLTVDLWGGTDWPGDGPDHHVVVAVNGEPVAEASFNGIIAQTIEVAMPAGLLHTGSNSLALVTPGDTGVAWDVVMLDGYSLSYPRAFKARQDQLLFSATGERFTVTGLSSADVVVYRLEGNTPVRLGQVLVSAAGGGYQATFAGMENDATYLVSTAASLATPELQPARPPRDITSGTAQYLMIVHPDFAAGIEPLAQYHRSHGMDVRVVDAEDVYRQFSYGEFDPQAIHDFIAYAAEHMGTEMVLLVGGDSYDYRHYLGQNSISFIPSLYAATDPVLVKFAPVDPLYADLDGDRVPDLPIGRFPVRTAAELNTLVAKTLAYATKDYGQTAVFAADKQDGPLSFEADSDALIDQLPPGWAVERAYLDDLGVSAARASLLAKINQGVALTGFFGHSGMTHWSFENLFTTADARALTNTDRPTVVTQWGCWNTYHVQPDYNTLGHTLLLSGDRGAAAVLGAATLTRASSDRALGQLVTPRLAQPGVSIGVAVQDAKATLATTQPDMTDVLLGWTLLGDPALIITP